MGAHRRSGDPRSGAERPTFDEVARGYDPRQVDDYMNSMWRYASEVTARAAAAEAALDRERRAQRAGASEREAGDRIGLMLSLAQQEADQITGAARRIAERALEEAVEDAASNNPVVRQARDQADRLLADAYEEAERRAKAREEEVNAQLAHTSARLEAIRHQQGEILGALLRLRGLLTSDEIDRSLADLARAATSEAPPTVGVPPPVGHPQAGPGHPGPGAHAGHPGYAGQHPGHPGQAGPPQPDAGMPPPRVPNRPPSGRPPGPTGRIGPEDDIIDAEIVEE